MGMQNWQTLTRSCMRKTQNDGFDACSHICTAAFVEASGPYKTCPTPHTTLCTFPHTTLRRKGDTCERYLSAWTCIPSRASPTSLDIPCPSPSRWQHTFSPASPVYWAPLAGVVSPVRKSTMAASLLSAATSRGVCFDEFSAESWAPAATRIFATSMRP